MITGTLFIFLVFQSELPCLSILAELALSHGVGTVLLLVLLLVFFVYCKFNYIFICSFLLLKMAFRFRVDNPAPV